MRPSWRSMLTAAQLGPSWEYARRSTRMAGADRHRSYDFSVEPYRLAEAVWPHVFGARGARERLLDPGPAAGRPADDLVAVALHRRLRARAGPRRRGAPRRSALAALADDPGDGQPGRGDGQVRGPSVVDPLDSRGPPPCWAGTIHPPASPGPTPSCPMAPAASTAPWRRSCPASRCSATRPSCWSSPACARPPGGPGLGPALPRRIPFGSDPALVPASVSSPAAGWCCSSSPAGRRSSDGSPARSPPGSLYGPVDAARAVNATLWALIQGGSVYAAGAVLAAWASHRPRLAGAGVLLVVTADLALAGRGIVWTVPQADLDAVPQVARLIEQAERSDPSPGPFRIHRVEQWHPAEFSRRRSPHRLSELVAWEHDTLDRLHAEPYALPYTVDPGGHRHRGVSRFLRGAGDVGPRRRGDREADLLVPSGRIRPLERAVFPHAGRAQRLDGAGAGIHPDRPARRGRRRPAAARQMGRRSRAGSSCATIGPFPAAGSCIPR